ncbi:MAG: SusC/RagA family TonB-linked outer membrane protein [Cyclobacteriaceae bacterium]
MRKLLLLFLFPFTLAFGQDVNVTGRVTSSEDGTGLPGVNVVVKGTVTGTITDGDGQYVISAPENGTLIFSFIGFRTQEQAISSRSTINVGLELDIQQLAEIVVTAQGVERDERSLGYAVQQVKGSDIGQKSEPNLLNALQGRLAGVNISSSSGGAGASTNINIRGFTSFGGNQPLIVVDGIIFSNNLDQTQNTLFGTQPSNRLLDISPENIESVSVLKGPAAAVLYGSRAGNGAILITTKQGGSKSKKTEVTVTSSVNFQNVAGLPKLQNEYGQGLNNDFVNTSINSWGPAFGGSLTEVTRLQGDVVPYKAFENNVEDFYQQGQIIQNGVNIASGDAENNFSLSVSSTFQDGIIPTSEFNRNSLQFGGNKKLDNGLKVGSSLTYVKSTQSGVTQGNGGSALGNMSRIPRSYDLLGMPYADPLTGKSIYFSTTQNHPLWSTENEQLKGSVDRLFGFVKVGYDITPWLNVSYRATADTYTDRRKLVLAIGANRAPTGNVQENMQYNTELNGDLMITASRSNLFVEGLNGSVLLGQNLNQRVSQDLGLDVQQLNSPGFYNVSNGNVFTASDETFTKRRLVGFYADFNFEYKDYLFLELQGRVDKSSTLPRSDNSYFYPMVGLSFVPTSAFNIASNVLSYAKVRASAAKVGKDANPYLLNSVYVGTTYGNNVASIAFPMTIGSATVPGFSPSSRIGSNNLTPEFVTSYETGINLGLFQNKLSVDAGYFYTESENLIFNVAVSNASGFDTKTTNVGLITNRGIELEIAATPIKTTNFSWDVAFNWTRIRNEVVKITEGVTSSNVTGNSFTGIAPSIAEGHPYGVIIGTALTRNENGDPLINPTTGAFMPGTAGQVIANPNPDWIGGLTNTFTYKNLSLSALVDVKYGLDLYSFGWVDLKSNGSLAITAKDRELPRILPGVIDNGDGTFTKNYIQVASQTYWQGLGGLASEAAVFDATTYRLRELTLNYQLPARLLSRTPFGGVSVGASGRNLFFYAPYAPGDPELNTQGAGNIQGMDLSGAPNTRNYGFNIRITL